MAALRRLAQCVLAFLFLFFHTVPVTGQLPQDYQPRAFQYNGHTSYSYYISLDGTQRQVIDLLDLVQPVTIYLVYNCYYMTEICKNAKNFLATTRGQNMHPASPHLDLLLPEGIATFSYDSNTGEDKGATKFRANARRDKSCPDSWKRTHTCPEWDQSKPWKNDGQWYTSSLDPGTTVNGIMNMYDPHTGFVTVPSWIRYTCEEFPAASWVEGGNGPTGGTPASTRCAAFGTKAEQNWQGFSHQQLALTLKAYAPPLGYVKKQSAIFFKWYFRDNIGGNGIAAEVITEMYDADEVPTYTSYEIYQQKRKRNLSNSTRSFKDELHDRLMAKAATGRAKRHLFHANNTESVVGGLGATDSPGSNANTQLNQRGSTRPGGQEQQGQMEHDILASRWSLDEGALDNSHRRRSAHEHHGHTRHAAARHSHLHVHDTARGHLSGRGNTTLTLNTTMSGGGNSTLDQARLIVAKAIAESAERNAARYANPARNMYRLKPGTVVGGTTVQRRRDGHKRQTDATPPQLLEITDEIAQAAALVAEVEAAAAAMQGVAAGIGNFTRRQSTGGTFWMQSLARSGTVPWGDDPSYVVFRNVRDYGAVGNGVTDDTAAIKRALTDGKRCGEKCNGSTVKNAIVYFPPGTYLVSTPIPLPFGTQVIGDANSRPVILAAPSFVGLGVLSVDEYTGGSTGSDGLDQEWFINTANFYRQLRNLVIDVRGTDPSQKVACLHYQVAQATSTQNLQLLAGAAQTGIFAENGSGGHISDITFTGGAFGIYGGAQQFTAQRLRFDGCAVGVQLIWDWGWVWKSVVMNNVGVGFKLMPDPGQTGNIGSATIMDSMFTSVTTVVQIAPPSQAVRSGSTGLVLENVVLSGVSAGVADTSGAILLAGTVGRVDHWALGPIYSGAGTRSFSMGGKVGSYLRAQQLIQSDGSYFERAKPQYEARPVGDFVHVKDFGAKGDGVTDDTAAFQQALGASQGRILFVDAGSYILTSTLTVPVNSRIVGETWSQLVAYGSYFQDASNPKVLLKVGEQGQIGEVELQDLIITTKGATAGAILIEWNIKASSPGAAGMWDVHVRVGGAKGTDLTPAECPAITNGINPHCSAASLMMHITPAASGYFENMWLWGSDHMVDDPDLTDPSNPMVQNSVYVARGFLIESTHATWLYGTASEHAVFYQYNFNKASNIFAGMIQTESPYYQPTPSPPAPFNQQVGLMPGDPSYSCPATGTNEFSGCDESWALIIRGSSNILIAAAGLYSWFSTYSQDCIDGQLCQKALGLFDQNAASVRIENLVTIGAKYMAVMNGVGVKAADNLNVGAHPFWSQLSVLDVTSNAAQYNDLIWIDPEVWNMQQPQFTCIPPCHVQLPPWTSATMTINYPLLTVSTGTWKSTITKPPLTVTEWRFQPATITAAPNNKRQPFGDFFPVPAATTTWPAVTYLGPNGAPSTVSPTVAFPTPPASIGPNAPAPRRGSWPANPMRAIAGTVNSPVVDECSFPDDKCPQQSTQGQQGTSPNPGDTLRFGLFTGNDPDDDYDENWAEASIACPTKQPVATSTPAPAPAGPQPSPLAVAHPWENKVDCYNGGQKAQHHQVLDDIWADFCGQIGERALYWYDRPVDQDYNFGTTYNTDNSGISVVVWFKLYKRCTWSFTMDECKRYLGLPVDACNCGGVNGKQGGIVSNNCLSVRVDPNTKYR
ncbi:pectin lyase-like protein [Coniochaeta ligniaria NRRL 30616]|uniref:Pectin lyase-like protein n=1 Tax=Coniochaeta ligniaria NRRL 30616 TaxID=1408157 RepID=A0A1J7IDE4_9PEZI|nr:pectin lyase-like protein [Coniochaeta ligniaria NRRL 30616]